MISLNIEREMKLEAIARYLIKENMYDGYKEVALEASKEILDLLDSIELSTQEAWMEEERLREAEMVAEYSREACEEKCQ